MYYLLSRYYNPDWGRFINADGIIGQTGDLLGHNLFAYCKNNPINKFDSEGFNSIDYLPVGGGAGGGLLEVAMIGELTIEEALPEIEETLVKSEEVLNKTAQNLSSKIINGLRDSKDYIVKKGAEKPYGKVFKLNEDYKIVLRRDFDEFSHTFINHWNMEIQTTAGNVKENLHIWIDGVGKIIETSWKPLEKFRR